MSRSTRKQRLEYLLTRLLEGGVDAIPEAAARRMGEWIGERVRWPLGIRVDTVRGNLRRAFPDADPQWIERILRESYRHLGREAVAMVRLSRLGAAEIVRRTEIPRWDRVRALLEEGRGALLVTGHYGNWEMAAAAVAARGIPIEAVAKRQRNLLVDERITAARRRLGVGTIDMRREALRGIPRALAAGHAVGIVADQDAREHGIFVPFFGVPASTFRGPALFALRTGAPVISAVARRLPDHRYRVDWARVPVSSTGDLDADVHRLTAELAARLESEIRKDPAQYFWFHKRWKTRPPGEPAGGATGTTTPERSRRPAPE